MAETCSVGGCDSPVKVKPRRLCNAHYIRLQRSGPLPPIDRFWIKVDKRAQAECWEWTGRRNRDGYGMFGGRPAHRIAYEKAYKLVVPSHLHMDHLCRNHGCCNPDHLRPRDSHANMSDNGWRDRSSCKNGHPWTSENTATRIRDGRPHRVCRACDRVRHRGRP